MTQQEIRRTAEIWVERHSTFAPHPATLDKGNVSDEESKPTAHHSI